MNRTLLALLLVAAPLAAHAQDYPPPPPDDGQGWQQDDQPPPQDQAQGPSAEDFQEDAALDSNGQWVDTADYGQVWQPTGVSADWQPYEYGHWAWTDAGWAWVSDEPFGWAVYHYGRWGFSPDMGWYWVPGRVWAPAWVAWRSYGDYSGWCPLGPRNTVVVEPRRWVWVDHQHFLQPVYQHRVQPRTVPMQNLPPVQRGPHAGPPVAVVSRAIGREVRPLTVRESPAPRSGQANGGSVYFYRPHATGTVSRPVARPYQPAYGGQPRVRDVEPQPNAGPRVQTYGPRAAPPPQAAEPVRPQPVFRPQPQPVVRPQPQPVARPQTQQQREQAPQVTRPHPRSTTEQPHAKEK